MKLARVHLFLGLFLLFILIPTGCAKASDSIASTSQPQANVTAITLPQALTNGRPTLAEFGRGTCVPCKEMAPIWENLAIEYQDILNVSLVNVDDFRDLTNYYRIMTIPTQIGTWLVSGFAREQEAHKFYQRIGYGTTGYRFVKLFE